MRARAHTHTCSDSLTEGRTALCRSPDSVKSMINAGVRTTERTAVTPAPVLNIDGTSKKKIRKARTSPFIFVTGC